MKIKKGDKVKVITGKDRGKEGTVIRSFPTENRIKVEGINIITKHIKPSQKNQEGGIVKVEGKINVSNVMFLDSKAKGTKTSRVGYRLEDDRKVRFSKKTGNKIGA